MAVLTGRDVCAMGRDDDRELIQDYHLGKLPPILFSPPFHTGRRFHSESTLQEIEIVHILHDLDL